jgi:spore coat polysaccharide biosynthesis predicted glycosyltransferase SpsG
VSTASSTVYELLALGTPIVCQPIADNQDLIAVALERRNAATVLNRDAGEEAFRRAIEKYVDDPTLRRERRELGRELVDGNGIKRVCSEILSLVDQNNEA